MVSNAKMRANRKYNEKAYEQLAIRVPKGKRDEYRKCAESNGMTLRQFIITALDEKEERLNGNKE